MKNNTLRFFIIALALMLASCFRERPQTRGVVPDTTHRAAPSAVSRPAESSKDIPGVKDTTAAARRSNLGASDETLEGTLYVSGNEPFTRLTLALGPRKSIYIQIDSSRMKQLWKMQGQRVSVTGKISKSTMGDAIIVKEYKVMERE